MGEVVFEVGQVVRVSLRGWGRPERVMITRLWPSIVYVHGISLDDYGHVVAFVARAYADDAEVLAPAPRPGQRWESDPSVEVQIVDADGELVVEPWHNCDVLCRGSVVDVARWLATRNYRCVIDTCDACVEVENTGGAWRPHSCGRTNLEISCGPTPDIRPMAALASAVAEIFAAPSRDDSRRYVDMAVKALRCEPFAKAVQATLVHLVGDRISVFPSANEIMATVDACHAWEHARGRIAPAKRTLGRSETWELTEVAKLAAWARVPMRDASDIGEIVAETYERARTVC